jgi:hypothetical protein
MQSSKRRPSASPPLRRPSKTREFRGTSGVYKPRSDSLHNSSNGLPTHHLDCSREETVPSSTTVDVSFNSLLSHHPSGTDTVSPLEISYPVQSHSAFQYMTFTPADKFHSPKVSANRDAGQKMSSAYQGHDVAQYGTETKPPNFTGEDDYLVDFEIPGHGTYDQELPVTTKIENDLNSGFDFDLDLWSPAFVDSMPNNFLDTAFQQDASASAHIGDDYLPASGDRFPIFGSPLRSHPLSVKHPQKPMGSASCSESTRTCMSSALKILQTLHIPPRTCLWARNKISIPSSRQPRMIDSVLATNKDIVRLVSDMLKCTCSSSSQMQLILTIICGKVMAWYRAMIRNDNQAGDYPVVPSNIDRNTNDEDQIERILHQPITVGCYSFGGTLENKIRTQVVFSELQHLETLVETLSTRIQGANFGTTSACTSGAAWGADPGPPRQDAETIRRSLSAFLRNQLQAAKGEPTTSTSKERAHGQDVKQRPISPNSS